MKLTIAGVLFFLTCPVVQGQTVLKGMVYEINEQKKQIPLPGASIFWLGTGTGTITNSNGQFIITWQENSKLVISYVGYMSDTIAVNSPQELKIELHKSVTLKEVHVDETLTGVFINPLNPIKTEKIGERELRKAACCNLSESFETSTSVDVNYADAVTGVKQIQMLGLEGKYSLMTLENQPRMRGLATNYGLSYIPGPWVESIQLSKGTGSVVNGYESIGGQINVELKKPESAEKLYFNQYVSSMGRTESNLSLSRKLNSKWSTGLLLHGDLFDGKIDRNRDGFLDIPVNNQVGLIQRWKYQGLGGTESEFGIRTMNEKRYGGQTTFDPAHEKGSVTDYGVSINTNRYEFFGKIGYVWEDKPYKSVGFTTTGVTHDQNSWFGIRRYSGKEQSAYANLIYQSIIGTTAHKFRTGASFLLDNYHETYDSITFTRREMVPGVFGEYTWNPTTRFTLVGGFRYDYHNLFGHIVTPRLHLRYAPWVKTTIRLSAGRGQRVANIFAENTSVFASSRKLLILSTGGKAYGLNPEIAWNYGFNIQKEFRILSHKGSLAADVYRTDFENQVIADRDASPGQVLFYNRHNASYVNSFQLELNYEPVKRLLFKTAYRWLDMNTRYLSQTMQQPFVANNRWFANWEYTNKHKWSFDYTLQWYGSKRLPVTSSNPDVYEMQHRSPSYWIMNAQLSKQWKTFDAYIGVENLTNFRQKNLIIDPKNPFGPYFDASLVWGPVYGRMFYAGIRYKIK